MDGSAGLEPWSIHGAAGIAVITVVILTWPVSGLLLSRYRRSVARGMRRIAAPVQGQGGLMQVAEATGLSRAPGSAPHIEVVAVGMSPGQILVARARARSARAQVVFAVAGLGFGIASAVGFLGVAGAESTFRQVVTLTPLLAWLTVPTLLAIGVQDRRSRGLLVAGYIGLVVLTMMVYGDLGAGEVVVLLVILVLLPAVLITASGARGVRGAAWLVAPSLLLLTLAAQALYFLSAYLRYRLVDGTAALLLVTVGFLALGGITYGWGIARLHSRGWASDETLRMVQWWLVVAVFQALLLGGSGTASALLGLLPIVVLVAVLAVAALRFRPPKEPPARLLLLRTFGARRRSARLLRDLALRWRWVGSVELIAGVDLASETVDPDAFLTFLRGRLSEHFVRHPTEAKAAVDGLGSAPARDGRYGVHELLCHDDTWRAVLRAFIDRVDAVLIDLRGLTQDRQGVLHELEQLVALVPLQRVVAVVDETTDAGLLRSALDHAVAVAPRERPFGATPNPTCTSSQSAGAGRRTPNWCSTPSRPPHPGSAAPPVGGKPPSRPTPSAAAGDPTSRQAMLMMSATACFPRSRSRKCMVRPRISTTWRAGAP